MEKREPQYKDVNEKVEALFTQAAITIGVTL